MHTVSNSKFKISTILKLAIILNRLLIGNQLINDSDIKGVNFTTEWSSDMTEIYINDTKDVTYDNYSLFNTSYPFSNKTSIGNYTIFQDYNETNPFNFSYEENVTYVPQIDETRLPDTSLPCTCDLTGDNCDVNCCCDKDCTDRDKDAFYGCIPPPINVDERHCVSKTIIYDDRKIKEKMVERDGLFCIMQDHLKERHEYLEPPILRTKQEYHKFVPNPTYSWISASFIDDNTKDIKMMKARKSLYILTVDKVLTEWNLPTSIYNGYCDAYKAPKYMIDDEITCQQRIANITHTCMHNKWLKATTYYKGFFFLTSQFFLMLHEDISSESNSTYPFVEDEGGVHRCISKLFCVSVIPSRNYTCRDNSGIPQHCTSSDDDIPLPIYDSKDNVCKNVVTQVHYTIVHNGSVGITEITVTFETSTVDISQKSVSQYFSIRYYGTKNAKVFRRSGNPGYLLGHPVLAGNISKNNHFSSAVLLASDSNNWLTVMGSSANGYCSRNNTDRLSVKFKENFNTGCLYKVMYEKGNRATCSRIQEEVMNILNGFNAPLYVGMFGNSDIHNIGDWIKIQREDEPTKPYSDAAPDGGCSSIVLGVDIKIAYAYVGSSANPQSKIIGVLYKYLMSEYIRSPCMGPSCNVQVEHIIHLKTSVTFIDASRSALSMYAQIPVTKISFPHDFFYPLISGYSGSQIDITLIDWPFYVAFVWLIVFKINI